MDIQFKKFQAGGSLAPFLAQYSPTLVNDQYPDPVMQYFAMVGSPVEQAKAAAAKAKSTSTGVDDTVKLIKDMRGLDNDVQLAITQLQKSSQLSSVFGGITDPTADYYRNVALVNKVLESKEEYQSAYDQAKAQNALSEAAITSDGKVVVKDVKGNYNMVTPEQALALQKKGTAAIQKNMDLLNDRRHNSALALQNGVLNVVQNSTSFKQINDTISALMNGLGSSEISQQGYTTKEQGQIQQGIAALKDAGTGSMDGVYKVTYKSKTQEAQAKMALDAIYRNLNDTQKAYLKLHSNGTDAGAIGLVKEIVLRGTSSSQTIESDYQSELNTDGSKKSSSGSGSDPKNDAAALWAKGYGQHSQFPIRDKGMVAFNVSANSIALLNDKGKPVQTTTLDELGRLGGIVDPGQATMNGARINSDQLGRVVADGGRVYASDLPVDQEALREGTVRPDLALMKKIENVNNTKLGKLKTIPQDKLSTAQKKQINQIYQREGIPAKYDQNGNLNSSYRRFAMFSATASEQVFQDSDPKFTIDAQEASDESRTAYTNNIRNIKKESKFKLDDGFFSKEKLYQGVVYMPMSDNYVDIMTGSNEELTPKQTIETEYKQQRRDWLMSQYQNPGQLK